MNDDWVEALLEPVSMRDGAYPGRVHRLALGVEFVDGEVELSAEMELDTDRTVDIYRVARTGEWGRPFRRPTLPLKSGEPGGYTTEPLRRWDVHADEGAEELRPGTGDRRWVRVHLSFVDRSATLARENHGLDRSEFDDIQALVARARELRVDFNEEAIRRGDAEALADLQTRIRRMAGYHVCDGAQFLAQSVVAAAAVEQMAQEAVAAGGERVDGDSIVFRDWGAGEREIPIAWGDGHYYDEPFTFGHGLVVPEGVKKVWINGEVVEVTPGDPVPEGALLEHDATAWPVDVMSLSIAEISRLPREEIGDDAIFKKFRDRAKRGRGRTMREAIANAEAERGRLDAEIGAPLVDPRLGARTPPWTETFRERLVISWRESKSRTLLFAGFAIMIAIVAGVAIAANVAFK